MLHLPTHNKQEVPHNSHAMVAAPGGHGRQLAPVRPACDAYMLLCSRVEIPQLPDSAHLPLTSTGYVEGERLETRPRTGRLAEGLGEGGVVVVQGLLHEGGCSRAGLDQRVATGKVVQCGDVHQAIANMLEQILSVLVATVMFQPQNDQLEADGAEKKLFTLGLVHSLSGFLIQISFLGGFYFDRTRMGEEGGEDMQHRTTGCN